MTQPNLASLSDPIAEEELRSFVGRGGKTLTYVEDETVMDRLDAALGVGRWSVDVEPITAAGAVKVTLSAYLHDQWVNYSDFGYPNNEGGESLKEAVSDGIRRCGRFLGIARDIYRKDTYRAPQAAQNAPQRPTLVPSGSVATPRPAAPVTAPTVEPDWMNDTMLIRKPEPQAAEFERQTATQREFERQHGVAVAVDNPPMTLPQLFEALDAKGIPRQHAVDTSKRMFGQTLLKTLSNAQRGDLWAEVSG